MNYLKAELLRTKSHTLMWLPLLGIPVALVSILMAAGTSPDPAGLAAARWQGLYITGLAAPVVALFAASAEAREKIHNFGSTAWLPVSPRRTSAARFFVVTCAVAAFHLVNFGLTWLLAGGSARVAVLGLCAFLGSLGIFGVASAFARRMGTVPTVALALAWQIGCGLASDTQWWWAVPGAWPVRLTLPVMETYFSLVPLPADHPIRHEPPWLALALCLGLALLGAALAVVTPVAYRRPTGARFRFRGRAAGVLASGATASTSAPAALSRPRPLRAVSRAAFTPVLRWCIVAVVLALLLSMRYPAAISMALATYVLFPLGTGLLPVLVWPAIAPAWNLMRVENPRVVGAVLVWMCLIVAGLAGVAAIIVHSPGWGIVTILTSCLIALVSLAVVLRFGTLWAIALTVGATIFSATIGGDVLAQTWLWVLTPPSWALTATTASRFIFAVTVALAGCVAGVLVVKRAFRRMPTQSHR
ncbi:hypothetical protein [Corynebacterium cystitidis]|uniref:ABC-2 type transport system permease protein n=1 Tax=Corynebacterium cystitidis DSM 20524 TaxID=1121357 RepID=A0A1H9VJV0_9CORY|nr:hypothetical protein [Corynebacterium cystitidis]WJY81436.1 hypothetical protein CCYS_02315 [Corynebacterium cystitidis DSM 20524]SES21854.1 ABC-2 type transport system permease protein [Corynebacterium cystitidis DSM 20524]SNV87436.1 hypothetical membrane protein [Corynebacterium cystitidis]